MMVVILLLSVFHFSSFADIAQDSTIPTGEIVNEELYWRSFNDFVGQQEVGIDIKSNLILATESLKNLVIKEKMYLDLDLAGASSKSETEAIVLKRKQREIAVKTLKYSLDASKANLNIYKARMEASLKKGFDGDLSTYIKKKNSSIYNSKCQERYLKVYLHRVNYDQANKNYKRMIKLYTGLPASVSYETLIDQRLEVVAGVVKAKAWFKLSQNCLKSKIKPLGTELALISDLSDMKVPVMPEKN